jgi:dUTP pyrophosphatase
MNLRELANVLDRMRDADGHGDHAVGKEHTDLLQMAADALDAKHPDDVLIRFTDERQAREGGNVGPFIKTARPGDVGHDLPAWLPDEPIVLQPGDRRDIPSGQCICLPHTLGAFIMGRSSTYFRLGLEVIVGTIDSGYTGELRTMVLNRTQQPVTITNGQRLGQVLFFPAVRPRLVPVDVFPATDRGTDGFGSTGA